MDRNLTAGHVRQKSEDGLPSSWRRCTANVGCRLSLSAPNGPARLRGAAHGRLLYRAQPCELEVPRSLALQEVQCTCPSSTAEIQQCSDCCSLDLLSFSNNLTVPVSSLTTMKGVLALSAIVSVAAALASYDLGKHATFRGPPDHHRRGLVERRQLIEESVINVRPWQVEGSFYMNGM